MGAESEGYGSRILLGGSQCLCLLIRFSLNVSLAFPFLSAISSFPDITIRYDIRLQLIASTVSDAFMSKFAHTLK